MADLSMVTPQVDDGRLGLLGSGSGPESRQRTSHLPKFMKGWKAKLGTDYDYVEIEGMEPIEAISADWSDNLVAKDGTLCTSAPVHFDYSNSAGSSPWGPAARGAIVVTIRSQVTAFDEMAHNAAESGALGVIIVDNEPKTKNNFVMTPDELGPPSVPAVLLSHKHAQIMCGGCNGAMVAITRRRSKLSTTKIAKSLWPF